MEVWANNSAPLSRAAAEEAMVHWYKENDTYHGRWKVGGAAVNLSDIACPVFVAAPAADRLVPQDSAFSVGHQIKNATTIAPPSGHIGMVVGDRAKEGLWRPMVNWLKDTLDAA
jgi:poly(3-hydroxyalkanoate) synthetase